MNSINKISFGQVKTSANLAPSKEVIDNYKEAEKIEGEYLYKRTTKDNMSLTSKQPKTEQELHFNLLNKGGKIERTSKSIAFGSLQITLKDDDEKQILSEILDSYLYSKEPQNNYEYKMIKNGNKRILSATPYTERKLISELEDKKIEVKEIFLNIPNKIALQDDIIKPHLENEINLNENFYE